jgi:hypothetical protein
MPATDVSGAASVVFTTAAFQDADRYEQLMGRWSRRLAPSLIRFGGLRMAGCSLAQRRSANSNAWSQAAGDEFGCTEGGETTTPVALWHRSLIVSACFLHGVPADPWGRRRLI